MSIPVLLSPAPGWYPDPAGIATYRWWDGDTWTEGTHSGLEIAPELVEPARAVTPEPASALVAEFGSALKPPIRLLAESATAAPAGTSPTASTSPAATSPAAATSPGAAASASFADNSFADHSFPDYSLPDHSFGDLSFGDFSSAEPAPLPDLHAPSEPAPGITPATGFAASAPITLEPSPSFEQPSFDPAPSFGQPSFDPAPTFAPASDAAFAPLPIGEFPAAFAALAGAPAPMAYEPADDFHITAAPVGPAPSGVNAKAKPKAKAKSPASSRTTTPRTTAARTAAPAKTRWSSLLVAFPIVYPIVVGIVVALGYAGGAASSTVALIVIASVAGVGGLIPAWVFADNDRRELVARGYAPAPSIAWMLLLPPIGYLLARRRLVGPAY